MKKRRLTTTAVLATLLSSSVVPSVTQASQVEAGSQHNDQSSGNDKVAAKDDTSKEDSKEDKEQSSTPKAPTTVASSTSQIQQSSTTPAEEQSKSNLEQADKKDEDNTKASPINTGTTDTASAINAESQDTSVANTSEDSAAPVQEPVVPNNEVTSTTDKSETLQDESKQEPVVDNTQKEQDNSSNANQAQGNKQNTNKVPNKGNQSQPKVTGNSKQQPKVTTYINEKNVQAPAAITNGMGYLQGGATFNVITNTTGEEFIESIGEYAAEVAAQNDLYASVMIAQACLESGYGSSSLAQAPYYNFFGIKGAYEGQSVSMSTQEDGANGMYSIVDSFRQYPSPKEAFEDYAKLLRTDMYKGAWKSNTNSYQDATNFLTGRYATDHEYAAKLNAIIEAYDLTKYDNYDGSASKQLARKQKEEDIFYKIKLGDTLSKIAAEYNTTVEELQEANKDKIQDVNLIFADTELKVGKKVTYEYSYTSNFDSNTVLNAKQGDFALPLAPGTYVKTSEFGNRGGEHHDGIDLATPSNSNVYAAKDGRVCAVGYDPSAGNYIFIDHGNGVYTNYFHLNAQGVKVGDEVKQGQLIAKSGSTGNSTGPHLHFGISHRVWGAYVNPEQYLNF